MGDYQYPGWALALGWIIAMLSILPIPIFAVLAVIRAPGFNFAQVPISSYLSAQLQLSLLGVQKFRNACRSELSQPRRGDAVSPGKPDLNLMVGQVSNSSSQSDVNDRKSPRRIVNFLLQADAMPGHYDIPAKPIPVSKG